MCWGKLYSATLQVYDARSLGLGYAGPLARCTTSGFQQIAPPRLPTSKICGSVETDFERGYAVNTVPKVRPWRGRVRAQFYDESQGSQIGKVMTCDPKTQLRHE